MFRDRHTAHYESTGGSLKAHEDPYIIQRGVHHRLNNQIIEENNNRSDLIAVQNNFAQFEAHVLATIQTALGQLNQVVGTQCEQVRNMYAEMTGNAQTIAPDFEWNGFIRRNNNTLIDPNAPPRSIENTGFANQNHRSTQPVIAGSLERKGKLLKKYDTAFWVVTPSKYMHEFKTDDDFAKDPAPETSLYLPDCVIGALDGPKFNVKGKDASGSSIGNKLSMSHEFAFRAKTPQEAERWYEAIRSAAGQVTNSAPNSNPTSPAESRQASAAYPVQPAETAPMTSAEREGAQAQAAGENYREGGYGGMGGVSALDKAY